MKKDNIHCKIELIKDAASGKMTLSAHLNPQAPNIISNDQTISWTPTLEEQYFLIEAISLIQKQKNKPIVTFRKKNNDPSDNKNKKPMENIESINKTIDNLSLENKKNDHNKRNNETIEEIIKQNIKQE